MEVKRSLTVLQREHDPTLKWAVRLVACRPGPPKGRTSSHALIGLLTPRRKLTGPSETTLHVAKPGSESWRCQHGPEDVVIGCLVLTS